MRSAEYRSRGVVGLRLADDVVDDIDKLATEYRLSRSVVIRALVLISLQQQNRPLVHMKLSQVKDIL